MLKNLKKVLSVVLVFCMIMSMLSMTALADTQDEEPVVPAGEDIVEPAEGQDDETDEADETNDEEAVEPAEDQTDETEDQGEEPDASVDDEVKYPIVGDGFEVDVDAEGAYVVTFTGTGTLSRITVNEARKTLGGKSWTAVIGPDITAIGLLAFNPGVDDKRGEHDWTLTSVEIGASVTSIGKWAFWGCEGLNSVTFAEGNYWTGEGGADAQFQFCTSLKSIKLPDSMTKIPGYCFAGSGLTGIEIPSGVTTIGMHAFKECKALTEVNFPEGLETIEELAFQDCSALTTVTFKDGLKTIGNSAFNNCVKLAALSAPNGYSFPDSLTTIEASAFQNCGALESIRFPRGLETIEGYAFDGSGVTKGTVVLPESLVVLGDKTGETPVFNTDKTIIPDKDKIFYYEGYTVYGKWKNSRVFCLNGGSYDYTEGAPVSNKGKDHIFVGWYQVPPEKFNRQLSANELEAKGKLVYKLDSSGNKTSTPAELGDVVNLDWFPINHYYYALWECSEWDTFNTATCTADGKEYQQCKAPDCQMIKYERAVSKLGHEYDEDKEEISKRKEYSYTDENGVKYNVVEKYYPCIRGDAYDCRKHETSVEAPQVPDKTAYKLTYLSEGEEFAVKEYCEGDTIEQLETDPEKEDHSFKGWAELPETMPAHDLVVIAQWECGHKDVKDLETWTKTKDGDVTKQPTCTEEGSKEILCTVCEEKLYDKSIDSYGHDEYYTEDENGVVVRAATKAQEGLMRWTCHRANCNAFRETPIPRIPCTVTFNSNGGTFLDSNSTSKTRSNDDVRTVNVLKGGTVGEEIPNVEREGYELTGWGDKDGNRKFTKYTPVRDDMTVYAQWKEIEEPDTGDSNTTNPEPEQKPSTDPEPAPRPGSPVTVAPIVPAAPSQPKDEDIPSIDPPMSEEPDDEDIPDDDLPLAGEPDDEEIPDDDLPLAGEPDDEDIPDDSLPLAEEPDDEDIPDDEPPLASQPDVEDIPAGEPEDEAVPNSEPVAGDPPVLEDEEIADSSAPLADVPQTGDSLVMWLSAAALSGAGLVLVSAVSRKREEEDGE